jgi:hypothetical protein
MSETLGGATEITAAELFGTQTEKPAPEAKPSDETLENSEAQSTEPDEDAKETSGEGDETKDEKADTDESSDEDQPKGEKQKGFGKRISKLVKKNQNLSQELEYWKTQAMGAQSGKTQSTAAAGKAVEGNQDARPKADDYESYEDYQIALGEYSARKAFAPAFDELKKSLGPKTEPEADKIAKAFEKRTKDFVKEHKDYSEAVQSLAGIDVDKSVERAIVESDHGPALLYELGKNPDLAEEIAELPPHRQLKEIGKLEAKIEARLEAKKATPLKTTKAPAPPNPVGSKSEGKKQVSDPNVSTIDFFKLRNEEEKRMRNQFF